MTILEIVQLGEELGLVEKRGIERGSKIMGYRDRFEGLMELNQAWINPLRGQYNAENIAMSLEAKVGRDKLMAVTRRDIYVKGLNFVFGIALPWKGVAVLSTYRLRDKDETLFEERVAKETAHELGHLLGLGHCRNRLCLMSFSNSLSDVDEKRLWLCDSCKARLGML